MTSRLILAAALALALAPAGIGEAQPVNTNTLFDQTHPGYVPATAGAAAGCLMQAPIAGRAPQITISWGPCSGGGSGLTICPTANTGATDGQDLVWEAASSWWCFDERVIGSPGVLPNGNGAMATISGGAGAGSGNAGGAYMAAGDGITAFETDPATGAANSGNGGDIYAKTGDYFGLDVNNNGAGLWLGFRNTDAWLKANTSSLGTNMPGWNMTILSGVGDGTAQSGNMLIATPDGVGTGDSGSMTIQTGNAGSGGAGGNILITTNGDNSSSVANNNITILTGTSASATPGGNFIDITTDGGHGSGGGGIRIGGPDTIPLSGAIEFRPINGQTNAYVGQITNLNSTGTITAPSAGPGGTGTAPTTTCATGSGAIATVGQDSNGYITIATPGYTKCTLQFLHSWHNSVYAGGGGYPVCTANLSVVGFTVSIADPPTLSTVEFDFGATTTGTAAAYFGKVWYHCMGITP